MNKGHLSKHGWQIHIELHHWFKKYVNRSYREIAYCDRKTPMLHNQNGSKIMNICHLVTKELCTLRSLCTKFLDLNLINLTWCCTIEWSWTVHIIELYITRENRECRQYFQITVWYISFSISNI
jgi:hypothetical protein